MPRKLRPGERDLWSKVTEDIDPLRRARSVPAPKPVPSPPPPPTPTPIAAFRIGSKRTAPIAPPPQDKTLKPAPRMDAKLFSKMVRGRMRPEARLDLHGMTVAEAHPKLMSFITLSAAQQRRLVLVITGKGHTRDQGDFLPTRAGILRQSVPVWLRQAPIAHNILEVTPAHPKHGGTGAYYVYLKASKP